MSRTKAAWLTRFRANDPEVLRWYPGGFDAVAQHAHARTAALPKPLAAAEADDWRAFLRPHDPPAQVNAGIEALGQQGTLAVVTGQQAGLFGGPFFTLVKAAAAIRWARRIESETGMRTVPVFWVASDDHDFVEVASHAWLDATGAPREWRAPADPIDDGKAVFRRVLERERFEEFLALFLESTPPSEFRDATAQLLREIAGDGVTWEAQFVRLLLRWFGEAGLVPLVPRLDWLRQRAAPVIEREIARCPQTSEKLQEAGRLLEKAGAESGILHRAGNEANFFVEENGIRSKVLREGDRFVLKHSTTGEELLRLDDNAMRERLKSTPGDFSPGAALRPLVQDAALPTVAYIAGPAELVYHAQIGPLYEAFGVFRPLVLPRPHAIVVEPRVQRFAEKLGLTLDEALAGGVQGIQDAAARSADRGGLRARVNERTAAAHDALDALVRLLRAETADTGLVSAAEKMRDALDGGSGKLDERLDKWLARRDAETARQAESLAAALFPGGVLQERALGALSPFLRVGGPNAPARLVDQLDETDAAIQCITPTA